MTILSKPWRIDRRGERLYIDAPGEVCVDICTGTPEDRARVMALLEQVPRMASLLRRLDVSRGFDATSTGFQAEVNDVLRLAGVLDE